MTQSELEALREENYVLGLQVAKLRVRRPCTPCCRPSHCGGNNYILCYYSFTMQVSIRRLQQATGCATNLHSAHRGWPEWHAGVLLCFSAFSVFLDPKKN